MRIKKKFYLAKGYIIQVLILIICLVISWEIYLYYFIIKDSKEVYDSTFEDTLHKSTKKATESMETIN